MSSNSLGSVVQEYTTILDELITKESLTTDLNMNQELIGEFKSGGKVEIPKLSVDGLGNYNKSTGFVSGGESLTWEEVTLANDRGRKFFIDAVDDLERAAIVSMNVMSTFAKDKVVPEIDAIRFAKLADKAGTKVSKTFNDASEATNIADAKSAILTAESTIEENGGKLSNCILYVSSAFKKLLRQGLSHSWGNEQGPDTTFETFDGMKVVTVPAARFYSKLTLNDGTTDGQTDGGYAKHSDGKDINFMIVDPVACAALGRHETLRYFAPDVNQSMDAHLWQYRVYHDMYVFDNKASLIYVSKKA